ncbi:MAG TPA: UTP--glucose-1-phosphate uridylyltransferase [Gemmataceae bacterium]|nr:UTP--glucose-1-phosphate uridylyltransferase [Gemmataceae bacterium]
MTGTVRTIITAADPLIRDQALDEACAGLSLGDLLSEAADLETFRHGTDNLYEKVRALFFLSALHRYHLPARSELPAGGRVPFAAHERMLDRRYEEAVRRLLAEQTATGPTDALSSGLSAAYRALAFETLAGQVRRSVRGCPGNRWMFRATHPADHPLRIRPELLKRPHGGPFPVLRERTPVRMDVSHSCWSDIFFLGMDYPEGARVLNVSIDLGVRGRDSTPKPPVEVYLRVIDEPILRLASLDLDWAADLTSLSQVFDFAADHLGLLKAAVIASGLVPPGLEGSGEPLTDVLARVVGPGFGLELVSFVHGIPKGSRLAVSTNLLAGLIAAIMRATSQAASLTGPLAESERRLVAARAILGEWLGGSGGGWQDSGGVWPGAKLIEGVAAVEGDPEFGISRGRLLPKHTVLGPDRVSPAVLKSLEQSLVLVHGGMAQNVGPVLEMVTEKYLLRGGTEWQARQDALRRFDGMVRCLEAGDVRGLGQATTENFFGPIQAVIPWATNHYTETLVERVRAKFGQDFWGFWMLGGMSGGGMGFVIAPSVRTEAQAFLQATMSALRRELDHSLPFAMEPVVYDFAVNAQGTTAELLNGDDALLPPTYYALVGPLWLRQDPRTLAEARRAELDRFATTCRRDPTRSGLVEALVERMLPRRAAAVNGGDELKRLLAENGFDRTQHERIRADLQRGRIGLAQNRLPAATAIEDVRPGDVIDSSGSAKPEWVKLGTRSLVAGEVAVVTLSAGAGSRWTQGAGVVKALHPFVKFNGKHRTFLEIHLAKSRSVGRRFRATVPHVITTGYMTHKPIGQHLAERDCYAYPGPLHLSPGRSVGLRLVPTARDLQFAWEETAQQRLDEQAQKVRDSLRAALLEWAKRAGEASDYTDNQPLQCLHPVGHWTEVPNLLRNGVLAALIAERPSLRHLFVHNIDTLGAGLDPGFLGQHIASSACLTFEMIPRRIDDRGGGLARVNGSVRIVEGLALPHEDVEFDLTYYNTLTTWVDIDKLLAVFGLTRPDLSDELKVSAAVHKVAARLPTYVTLKDVKKRWGLGQEDVFPVCQFEKLWGDMTALPDVACNFTAVSRVRGQQLKDPAQLDGWVRDGSAAAVAGMCQWE